MAKPRIVVVDPSQKGGAAVATLLRFRRWNTTLAEVSDLPSLTGDASVLFAVENDAGDGLAALREASRDGSSAARILLCKPSMATRIVARGEPVHQVVARPANGDKVLAAVKRALRVGDLMGDPTITTVARSLARVPALPGTWVALNDLLQSDTATMHDATALVERDPGLAAKVLRLVNSGLFGADRPTASLFDALQRLGLAMVRDLVLSTELFTDVDDVRFNGAFGPGPLSTTSFLVACTARSVAPRAAVNTAFTSGLFHQLGRLAFATQAPDRFAQVIERAATGTAFAIAERQVFGVDSRAFAAWMLAHWGMPHEVVEAVQWSAEPSAATGRGAPLALSVNLGARLIEEAWRRVIDGTELRLVTRVELAPWGLSDYLETWRDEANELVSRNRSARGQAMPGERPVVTS